MTDRPNDYEARLEARRARLEARAAAAEQESQRRYDAADRIGKLIPMGQPIQVGHHSEQRHRADLNKIDRHMRASIDARDRAAELSARAAAVGTGGISSDDPAALDKLRAELAQLQATQAQMKQVNGLLRKGDRSGLLALGLSEAQIDRLSTPDFSGRTGYPAYALSNNSANIRRVAKRIADLEARPAAVASIAPLAGDGWRITVEDNRVCLAFDARTTREQHRDLHRQGFLWSHTRRAYVRKYSAVAVQLAQEFVERIGAGGAQ